MSEKSKSVEIVDTKKEQLSEDAKKYEKQVKKYKRAKARPFNLFCAMSGFVLLFTIYPLLLVWSCFFQVMSGI